MKTPSQIDKLNYNDIAFFFNIQAKEAKWNMAHLFFGTESILEGNLTKSGSPKIKITDLVDKKDFESKIKSNSNLDGKPLIDYTITIYNKVCHFKHCESILRTSPLLLQ